MAKYVKQRDNSKINHRNKSVFRCCQTDHYNNRSTVWCSALVVKLLQLLNPKHHSFTKL